MNTTTIDRKTEQEVFAIKASDIMTQSIMPASADWSVKDLAEFLVANGISGAPVVDQTEQLVGVVSVTDVARHASISEDEADIRNSHEYYTDTLNLQFDKELIHEFEDNENTTNTVHDIMTPKVHDIDCNASLQEVCHDMVTNRIHRIFVSSNSKIVGVISALDILAIIK